MKRSTLALIAGCLSACAASHSTPEAHQVPLPLPLLELPSAPLPYEGVDPQDEAAEGFKYTDEAGVEVERIRQAVELEAQALGEDHWAGDYYFGDGLGVNVYVSIAPEAGFAFEWHGCGGLYDRNYGSVEANGRDLVLRFALPNRREGFEGLHGRFTPVRWGNVQLMVAVDEMIEFCNAVNRGSCGSSTLVKGPEEEWDRSGTPNVPEEYLPYLLHHPIRATLVSVDGSELVTSVSDWFFRDSTITLDAGSRDGVLVGMQFNVAVGDTSENAVVATVSENSCTAVMRQFEEDPLPKPGWKLWTGNPRDWEDD